MHTPVEDSKHSYMTNRHRKTELRVVEGAPLSLEDDVSEKEGERTGESERASKPIGRGPPSRVKCVEVFSRTVRCSCESVPCNRVHVSFYPAIISLFYFSLSSLFPASVSYPLPCLPADCHSHSLSLSLSSATLDAPCITRRRSGADHTKRHS